MLPTPRLIKIPTFARYTSILRAVYEFAAVHALVLAILISTGLWIASPRDDAPVAGCRRELSTQIGKPWWIMGIAGDVMGI